MSWFRSLATVIGLSAAFASLYVDAQEQKVKPSRIRNVSVEVKGKAYNIACLAGVPGRARRVKNVIYFLSYSNQEKAILKKRLTAKSRKQLALVRGLKKAGVAACKNAGSGPAGEHLRLDEYTGSFGLAEAQLLYNRFALGATPAQLQEAVRVGLRATVDRLLTFQTEPVVDAVVNDIECDGWRTDDPQAGNQNRSCNTASNVNDFNRFGVRTGLLFRYIHSQNGLLHKLAFFLMDERLGVSHSAARDCERHAIKTYLNSVYRAASSGSYMQYMRDMNNDHLAHLRWLDGGTNRGGLAVTPNENYAREFWELGTVGPTGLDAKPVYSDLDIAQAALAFTGWNIDELNVNNVYTCLASYVPLFHTGGSKVIFGGTPYQATVDNAEDVLQATFRHPRAAEHLAEDLWAEFINPFATAREIRELAQIIRDNNFNLHPVMRKLMLSRALYAAQSRNSLIKHPIEVVVGFVKATGFPLWYRNYDTMLSRMEQQILNPPTVFGWNLRYLSGEQLQIEWWNVLMDYMINVDIDDIKTEYNWSYYDRFVADLHNAGLRTSGDVIDRVARDLGVPITPGQKAELDQMMNYYLTRYQCPAQCDGQPYKLVREMYDTDPSSEESGVTWGGQRKIRQLVAAIMQLPEARTK